MSDVKLGQIINWPAQRDAIHLAVAPVVAGEPLAPGEHCGLREDGRASRTYEPTIGVVDPFVKRFIQEGETFWLCLYPGTISGLRHHWSHPAFSDSAENSPSVKWLTAYAGSVDMTYAALMEAAGGWVKDRAMWGRPDNAEIPDDFWVHYEIVTGKKGEGSFFTCSC